MATWQVVSKSCLTQNTGGRMAVLLFIDIFFSQPSPPRHLLVLVKPQSGAVKEILLSGTSQATSDSQKGSSQPARRKRKLEKWRRINKDCQWWLMRAETNSVWRGQELHLHQHTKSWKMNRSSLRMKQVDRFVLHSPVYTTLLTLCMYSLYI